MTSCHRLSQKVMTGGFFMESTQLYQDISARTGGDIYIGVVGPVRTGKSTFIKRFMDMLIIPEIADEHSRIRARDELPQSAAGKTIMTTEPKFIPKEALRITPQQGMEIGVRLIDCVGFMVEGAAGHIEDNAERLVKTPWYDYEIPFTQAAEIGTEKVIRDHSTVGIIVTTDGSFGELPRENYLAAEQKTVEELKALGKPFLILMNTVRPFSQETTALATQLEKNYGVRVIPVNCEQLKKEDIERILKNLLLEFPVVQIDFSIPKWAELLPTGHWLKDELLKQAAQALDDLIQMKDVDTYCKSYAGMVLPDMMVQDVKCTWMDMSNGHVQLELVLEPRRYFQIISEFAGAKIDNEYQLIQSLKEMMITKREYDSIRNALEAVRAKGYGVVMPRRSEITLSEPELIRHGNRFGVKMKAYAPSISFIRASIETEIAPIVGDESQANDLMNYIRENSADGNDGVWNTSIFGKSIEQTVVDGMQAKVQQITEDCQQKLQDTMQKIINDSDGGMICIII